MTLVSIASTGLYVSRQTRTKRYTPRSEIAAAAARLSPANRNRQSGSALRIFLSIADLWKLTELERRLALGYPSRATFYLWCKRARRRTSLTLSVDVLSRISSVLGIQQVLEELFPTEQAAVDWLHENDSMVFGGQSPLSLITSGFYDDILAVRRFLDSKYQGRPPQANRIANALGRDADRIIELFNS